MAFGVISLVAGGFGWSTVVLVIVACIVWLLVQWRKQRMLPPGPYGFPYIGYLPFLGSNPQNVLAKLAEKYGDVMCLNVAGRTVIHLNSWEAIKEAFVDDLEGFNGRPDEFCYLAWIDNRLGIGQVEGPVWREQRRFLLHTLRDFGFGNIQLESHIHEVILDALQILKDTRGVPYDPSTLLSNSACNIVSGLLFNKKFEHNDPKFQQLSENGRRLVHGLVGLPIILTGPLTEHVLLKLLPGYTDMADAKLKVLSVVDNLVKEHEDTFDSSNIRDYTDAYLEHRMKLMKSNSKDIGDFSLDRLRGMVLNVFVAGTESVSGSICWALRILMDHKDVQKNLQGEIDEVVGRDRFPSIRDRPFMPYTEAFISEVQRYVTIFPFAPAHSNPAKATLKGYEIPKRSVIIANIWAVHHNPKYWTNPEKFDPSRFLDPNGKYEKREGYLPFSVGKRICPGESLAQMEMFLFVTSILQAFNLTSPESHQEALGDIVKENRTELSFKMCAIAR